MNVFYSPETQGLKEIPDFGSGVAMTVYFTISAVFSICSEGALYVSPRYKDGSFDVDNWVEVDFMEVMAGEGQVYFEFLTAVQDCLITDARHDPKSGYYQNLSVA